MEKSVIQKLESCRKAAGALRLSTAERKAAVLESCARLLKDRQEELLAANQEDLKALRADATSAFRDRLALNASRIQAMIESLRQVAALPDPVGEVAEERVLPSGLRARRVRSPLGVILMVFESRPNVAIEAFSIAFKAGNAILLRGGKESVRSVGVLYSILNQALVEQGLPASCAVGITDPNRELLQALLKERRWIDVVVPRGGDGLIEFVVEHSRIPIIKNDRGLCHIYVHEDADLAMAAEIVTNAKCQRPGVCNSMETLLVHRSVKDRLLPVLYTKMEEKSVRWLADAESQAALAGRARVERAQESSFDTEYLDYALNCRVVGSLEEAIEHIEAHGSRHSEAIITASEAAARRFQAEVDAAAVYWNASTRFTDGFEFGLGGELGISTQKLHVRGPVGVRELTSLRWILDGNGQIRK